MSAARARPPVLSSPTPCPSPHAHRPLSRVCRMSCLQRAPVRLSRRPPRRACPPHVHRPLSRVCRMSCLQHVPARPSYHRLAVPRPPHVHGPPSRVCVPAARARQPSSCQAITSSPLDRPPVHSLARTPARCPAFRLSSSLCPTPHAHPTAPVPVARAHPPLAVPAARTRQPGSDRHPRPCLHRLLLPCPPPDSPTAPACRPSPATRQPAPPVPGLCHVIALSTWIPAVPSSARYIYKLVS